MTPALLLAAALATRPLRHATPSRSTCAACFDVSGLATLTRHVTRSVRIVALAYHRIGSPDDSPFDHGLWSATPEQLDEHLRFLRASFDLITPRDLDSALGSRTGRFALVTFDDGYRDNHATALPILQANGVPATFFITTGFIDQPRLAWWDEVSWMVRTMRRRHVQGTFAGTSIDVDASADVDAAVRRLLRTYKQLPPELTSTYLDWLGETTGRGRYDGPVGDLWMTWDMVRDLRDSGMEIGGHTDNHPVLARLSPVDQGRELARCKQRIEEELGTAMTSFSYPVGGRDAFDRVSQSWLAAAGVRHAFNYYGGGRIDRASDPHNLPRIAVERHLSLRLVRAAVSLPTLFG